MSIKLEIGQADQLLLSFKYDEEIIKKVKTIKGRRWNSIQKKWVLPNNQNTMNEINKLFSTSEVIDCTKGNNKVEIITKDEVLIDMLQNELKLKGYSTKTIKSYLGHSSSKTTEIYTHVTRKSIQNISSLLDMIVRRDNQV